MSSKTKTDLARIRTTLKEEFKIDPDQLAVLNFCTGEQVIGEVHGVDQLVNTRLLVKDPKRFIRMQRPSQGGITIEFIIGALDLIGEGTIEAITPMAYWIRDLDEESQVAMLSTLGNYCEQQKIARIAASGLTLPGQPGFALPNLRASR